MLVHHRIQRLAGAIRSAKASNDSIRILAHTRPSSALYRLRTMSSTAAPSNKFQFMVYCPDKTDEGAFQRRLSVREEHLANAKVLSADGVIKFGRAVLSPESIASPGAEQKMVGSLMVFEGSSLEEVKKRIESDIYYTTGVWDAERTVILPFAGLPFEN